jgi:hypothetical protein
MSNPDQFKPVDSKLILRPPECCTPKPEKPKRLGLRLAADDPEFWDQLRRAHTQPDD